MNLYTIVATELCYSKVRTNKNHLCSI